MSPAVAKPRLRTTNVTGTSTTDRQIAITVVALAQRCLPKSMTRRQPGPARHFSTNNVKARRSCSAKERCQPVFHKSQLSQDKRNDLHRTSCRPVSYCLNRFIVVIMSNGYKKLHAQCRLTPLKSAASMMECNASAHMIGGNRSFIARRRAAAMIVHPHPR